MGQIQQAYLFLIAYPIPPSPIQIGFFKIKKHSSAKRQCRAHQNTEKEITTADSSGILGDVVMLNMGESEAQVPFGEVMIGREEKEVCNNEDQRTLTSVEEWEVEEAEPLYMQQQLLITEKARSFCLGETEFDQTGEIVGG
uniref:Uncharacterized protein n=1 Tax=Solanum tuberosum TaxID=4113 RepID=M1D350_SOLTU